MQYNSKGIVATILCLITPLFLNANMPKNVESFKKLPRSIAKDYYIYRYLKYKDINSTDAQKLLEQTKRVNFKLFYLFAKKLNDKGFTKVAKCLKMSTKELLKQDSECKAIGLSVSNALTLDKTTLKKLSKELKSYKLLSSTLEVLSHKDIIKEAIKNSDKFIGIFNSAGSYYRKKLFDKKFDKETMNSLAKNRRFNKSIEIIILQKNLKNLKTSLLYINPNQNLKERSLFYLALNALKLGKKTLAMKFLDSAQKKAYYRFDVDKILFWKYLITKNKKYLDSLDGSFDVNIYTILAHNQLANDFDNVVLPKTINKDKKYNIQNPFLWTKLLQKIKNKKPQTIKKIAKEFDYKNTMGQYTFLLERAEGYQTRYFPMPFYEYLKNYSNERKSLILAIARQESNFIPAAVSSSYALGMMQFMPFLATALAKQKKMKDFDLDDMFNPKIAYDFANTHLNYLVKKLKNPLLVAYAYNGGIGYTRRLLKSGDYFGKGEYEPYMSMELISYLETRRYGKKVLSNYIIYMRLLGEKVSIDNLVTNIKNPFSTK